MLVAAIGNVVAAEASVRTLVDTRELFRGFFYGKR